MALIKLKQIEANLSYDTGSNTLFVSGGLNITQTDPTIGALALSGSLTIVDSTNVASGSLNVDIIDAGEY